MTTQPETRKKQIGKNLQKMRKAAGFKSAKAFAEHIGVNPNTYTQYEQGLVSISFELAWAIADALDCTLDELGGRAIPNNGPAYNDDRQRLMNHAYSTMNDAGKSQAAQLVSALSTTPIYAGGNGVIGDMASSRTA